MTGWSFLQLTAGLLLVWSVRAHVVVAPLRRLWLAVYIGALVRAVDRGTDIAELEALAVLAERHRRELVWAERMAIPIAALVVAQEWCSRLALRWWRSR